MSAHRDNIADFIRDSVIVPRLKQRDCLVVYDPEQRYRELCLALHDEKCTVVDATESSLESREEALAALRRVGDRKSGNESLLVYVPARPPVTPEQKQVDPFSLYAACGAVFPDSDADGYEALCLRARPDHASAIRRVFERDPQPSFATIDAIGTGTGWPQLKSTLKAESPRDILMGILAPQPAQEAALSAGAVWVPELRDLCKASLGLELKTRARKWDAIADELWRFLLFSEFALGQDGELPPSLAGVPRASVAAGTLVTSLCEQLRSDTRRQATYVQRAQSVEDELDLPGIFSGAEALTPRDTFPFEERRRLAQAVRELEAGNLEAVRGLLANRARSLWQQRDASAAQWALLSGALELMERCDDVERELPDHTTSLADLIDFYTGTLREVDRLQREMEQAVPDLVLHDPTDATAGVAEKARSRYRKLAEKVHKAFVRHLESSGWPLPDRLSNGQVFDRFLAPRLQESGRRVGYVLVDALRYELGVELEKQLRDDGPVELHAAAAALPSITLVGMASLLPGAHSELRLTTDGDNLVPMLGGTPLRTVGERMEVLRRRYGDRFAEMTLTQFLKPRTPAVSDTVHLLVLRSVEIDSQLENNPDSSLPLVPQEIKRVRAALHRLRKQGFEEAIIATDHGFFLNTQAEHGDVCAKPTGNWVCSKDRSLLGQGAGDSHNLVLPAERVGIRGTVVSYACPRSLAPYRNGLRYFHSGASLQELVVPVLVVRLGSPTSHFEQKPQVTLSYKQGTTKRITTRLPAIDVEVECADLFATGGVTEFLLEAQDGKGNVVGEARPGDAVNAATGRITLKHGEQVRVTLKMLRDFEGRFTVKAVNPVTLAVYQSLALETDYTV